MTAARRQSADVTAEEVTRVIAEMRSTAEALKTDQERRLTMAAKIDEAADLLDRLASRLDEDR